MKANREATWLRLHCVGMGLFFALALLKFGNPCVMERFIERPTNGWEWLLNTWPNAFAYWFLGLAAVSGLFVARFRTNAPWWGIGLPAAWLAWQFISATRTIDPTLTALTLKHFTGCAVCFYLGFFCVGRSGVVSLEFWLPIVASLAVVFAAGFEQHFGGLEETRKYFYTYVYPTMKEVPPEYLKKISSNRIFGTLFYPNALAGAILLLLPAALCMTALKLPRLTDGARRFLAVVLAFGGLACLYWSGSKGGWLLLLAMLVISLLQLKMNPKLRWAAVSVLLLAGVAGFAWKYAAFFQKGATSVVARFDYWSAAVRATGARPLVGHGPGTFGNVYQVLKRPEAEMSRLAHNDYLQQFADSGVPGGSLFVGMMFVILFFGRCGKWEARQNLMHSAIGLGLLGFALQCGVEFGFYIPALAWLACCLGGMLLAARWNPIDTKSGVR